MKKTLLTILITAVIVGGGMYFWQTKNITVPDDEKQEYLVSTMGLFMMTDGNIVMKSGPSAGENSVTIDSILLPVDGVVKIFKNGEQRTEIGTSDLLSKGRHDNIVVSLEEPLEKNNLEDGNSYYVVALYSFELTDGYSPLSIATTGNPVEAIFTIE